jgi:hypothetical protein
MKISDENPKRKDITINGQKRLKKFGYNNYRSHYGENCFQIKYIRYADDIVIAIRHKKDSGYIEKYIDVLTKEIGLEINKEKSRLYDIDSKNGWKFLDYISKNRQDYNEETKGFYVCGQTEFSDLIDTCFNDEEYTKDIDLYRIIAYTNSRVAQWNNHVRHMIIQDADKSLITRNDLIMSYTTVVNVFNDIIINNSEEYIVKDIVDTVDNDYEFKGFLIKFQAIHGGSVTQPLFVIDHYDNYTFQMYYKKLTSLIDDAKKASSSERGSKWKQYFDFKRKYLLASNITNSNGKILFSRDLDYGFAITSHRAQGSTYRNVFVDINDMIYDKYGHPYTNRDEMLRRLYVACSRASNQLVLSYGK